MRLGPYRHFKGGRYELLLVARSSEDEQEQAVYADADGNHWVRPLAMWNEPTDRWPDGVTRPRFVPEGQV